jgi:hypothetical protein
VGYGARAGVEQGRRFGGTRLDGWRYFNRNDWAHSGYSPGLISRPDNGNQRRKPREIDNCR